MILADIILGAPTWLPAAIALGGLAVVVLAWSYWRTSTHRGLRLLCGLLKGAGILLIALCLVDPLYTGTRPSPGSNLFLVVADNSRSLQLADPGAKQSRGERMQEQLAEGAPWLTRLGQDFDVRQYAFDTGSRPMKSLARLQLDGEASALSGTLSSLSQAYRGQPVAGILLFTDGAATDLASEEVDWKALPPVYPVALASPSPNADVSVSQVSVSQTNFEDAPVTISAEIESQAVGDRKLVVRLLDESGKEVERRLLPHAAEGETLGQRFLVKPERPGVSFYQVRADLEGEEELDLQSDRSAEATLANNRRFVTVDRGGGPYRVLYVSGMPNWEFKFLRRAVEKDDEVRLVGLVRVAKKEPHFAFLRRSGERSNPLFRGFGGGNDETVEQYDEPVLLRLATEDKEELRGGFPKEAEELFRYHAVILDDVEAGFFTQDQLSLLQRFVSQRGGGLLMMGGKNSFAEGGYARTPVAEMLPVYLDRTTPEPAEGHRLRLTREGWLQPWVRMRSTEAEETQRLAGMPAFHTLNLVNAIKPGASVLAEVESAGTTRPALVVQPFGRGRTGALLIGDLWRWDLRRTDSAPSDLQKSWRQTVRWLVADVPQPVEIETRPVGGPGLAPLEIVVRVRDKESAPLDNASVKLAVQMPDKRQVELVAESSDRTSGEYRALFAPRLPGVYRLKATVVAADGSEVGQRDAGCTVEPETEEFRTLSGNRPLLERIARESGGEVIELDRLDRFVSSLPDRKIPVVEGWTYPIWHQWSVLMLAIGCLVGEWGLRRWRGLP